MKILPDIKSIISSLLEPYNSMKRSFHVLKQCTGTKVKNTQVLSGTVNIGSTSVIAKGKVPVDDCWLLVSKTIPKKGASGTATWKVRLVAGDHKPIDTETKKEFKIPLLVNGMDYRGTLCIPIPPLDELVKKNKGSEQSSTVSGSDSTTESIFEYPGVHYDPKNKFPPVRETDNGEGGAQDGETPTEDDDPTQEGEGEDYSPPDEEDISELEGVSGNYGVTGDEGLDEGENEAGEVTEDDDGCSCVHEDMWKTIEELQGYAALYKGFLDDFLGDSEKWHAVTSKKTGEVWHSNGKLAHKEGEGVGYCPLCGSAE